jgi:hypothetical protein
MPTAPVFIDGGNIFEEQQMELSAQNFFASVPEKNQISPNLSNKTKTKAEMQSKLHEKWLEMARKRLMKSRNRYEYLQNKQWLKYINKIIKSEEKGDQ